MKQHGARLNKRKYILGPRSECIRCKVCSKAVRGHNKSRLCSKCWLDIRRELNKIFSKTFK